VQALANKLPPVMQEALRHEAFGDGATEENPALSPANRRQRRCRVEKTVRELLEGGEVGEDLP
jgi:hypothetical protein